MLDLDGSDGGGQLVRSALAAAALTGRGFCMEGIRGARPTPGLRPQHLAAVRALAAITGADVEGATEGSEALSFDPGAPEPGRYEVEVGTAGSVSLLFDTVLPLACVLDGPLSLSAAGGTDVAWSPPVDYLRRVKLPLLRRHGLVAAVDLDRRGFYPAGGGAATLHVAPSAPSAIELLDRGDPLGARIYSTCAADLAERDVARRQASAAVEALPGNLEPTGTVTTAAAADSPGSALVVRLDYEGSTAGFDALGERGKPAEDVGTEAATAAREFHGGRAAVDRHLADQLAIFLAVAGGRVRIPEVTEHVATNCDLLSDFGFDVSTEGSVLVGSPGRLK